MGYKTKKEIDAYYTENYEDIVRYATSLLRKFNRDETAEAMVAASYEHLIELQPFEGKIKTYIGTFLYNNCYWTTNPFTERSKEKIIEGAFEIEDESEELITEDYRTFLLAYYDNVPNLELRASFEIYVLLKHNTIKSFAEYIGLSRSVAEKFIRNLKEDMKRFYIYYHD